jgi:hypothetical protein
MTLTSPSAATKKYPESEGICSSETLVPIYQATRRHNQKDANTNIQRHKNLKTV